MNISNYESDKIINGTNDNDTISNYGSNVTINALGGNDSLYNAANYYSKINGGDGKDTISNAGFRTEIEGNAGNDYIFNTGWDISINGATGNDTVFLGRGSKNEFIVYNVGDGNDVIYGFNESSTLSIAAASYTSSKSGNDIIVNVSNGKITLAGAANLSTVNIAVGVPKIYVDKDYSNNRNYVLIVGNDSNNNIENNFDANNVTIQTNGGNDSISNFANNVSISGGTGDDTIYGRGSGGYSFLGGDAGNDSIKNNGGYNVTTSGGEGNDTIRNWGYYDKINGGTGDDFIFLQSDSTNELILYNAGDGNDVINGFRADSTLSLAGTGYATTKSGDDVIVTVRGGQITLKGAGNLSKVNIIETPLNITNDKSNVTVLGTAYSDTITNKGEKVSISAQSGNDIIANSADNVTINAGTGNDSISLSKAAGNLIEYQNGGGNDIITGLSEKSSISIGCAAYTSAKSVNDVFIKVGDGVLTVRGGADLSTVNIIGTLDQSKNFNNTKDNALIIANDLDNTIENSGKNVRVFANGGNDSISNGGANVTIDGGTGDDTIYGGGSGGYSSLSGDAGNDSINNYGGYNVTTSGGAGNDTIRNWGYYDKINGGTGDDFIYLYSSSTNELIIYNAGDGKDTIEGFKTDSTLDIGGANYATERSGNDIIVYVGDDGEITLKGAAALSRINISGVEDKSKNLRNYKDNVSMVGSNYADTLENSGKNVTIIGNAGNDSIRSYGDSVSVDGGRGNDSIDNSGSRSIIEGGADNDSISNSGTNVTISGGSGNDTIYGWGRGGYSSLSGGAGNDTIRNGGGYNVTSSGGAGNDSIYNYGYDDKIDGGAGDDSISLDSSSENELILYRAGDGNDLIDGFKADSTLSINGGIYATTTQSGNDIIVTVGEGKITLLGAATLKTVNIVETPVTINNNDSNATIYGTNADDTIINTGENVAIFGLSGKDSLDNNNQGINSTIDGGAGDDKISNTGKKSTLTGQSGNDTIQNNADNVSISGGAGHDSIFNHGEEVSISGGAGNDIIENDTNSHKVLIDGGAGNDSIRSESAHNVTITSGDGNNIIENQSGTALSIVGGDEGDVINIKGALQNTILAGRGDDTISVDWSSNNALIIYRAGDGTTLNPGDGNDVIEDFNENSTLQIGETTRETYATQISGDDVIVTVADNKITIKNGAKLPKLNIDGLSRRVINNSDSKVELLGGDLNDSIRNIGFEVTMKGFGGNDTIQNYTRQNTIDAGTGDDFVESKNSNFVTIDGGAGNDAIVNRGGFRSTITGGAGNDSIDILRADEVLINYKAGDGDDYIEGFNASSSLSIAGGVFSTTENGRDVIVTVNENEITLAGAASISPLNILGVEDIHLKVENKNDNVSIYGTMFEDSVGNIGTNVTILTQDGNDSIYNGHWNDKCSNVTIDAGKGDDTIINEGGSTVSIIAGEGDDYIENSDTDVTISGDAGNDSIKVSGVRCKVLGGAGNDSIDNISSNTTITGGLGDDTISNNWDIQKGTSRDSLNDAGSNVVFNYNLGDGNDVIYGFKYNSTLSISGGSYSSQVSGSDIIVTVGDDNITLKNGADLKQVNIIGTNSVSKDSIEGSAPTSSTDIAREELPLNVANSTNNTLIVGTDLNDTIANSGKNVTIQAKGGNDSIFSRYSNGVTVDAGAGNDTIRNYSEKISIDGGADNDFIDNYSSEVTLGGGAGDDSIASGFMYRQLNITGDAGNDSINNGSSNVTIAGGTGSDTIYNNYDLSLNRPNKTSYGANVQFNYTAGDSDDIIYGFRTDSTLSIAGGYYTSQQSGNDIILTVGEGNITLSGAATLSAVNIAGEEYKPLNTVNYADSVSIVGTKFKDTIENYGSNVTILANGNNDTILNKALNTSILGGAGDDTVANIGAKVTILAEDGNDSINNYGKFSELDGGAGDDVIENSQWGNNALISGGAGNDTVKNWAVNTTIESGKGDDSIINYSVGVQFNYTAGDGNDVIEGFNATSTLSIAGGTYKLDRTDADLIITIGDENITLKGAATLSAPHIIGEQDKSAHNIENDKSGVVIRGTDESDTIDNSGDNVTILALGSDDSIYNGGGGTSVIIDAGAGNDTIENRHVTETTIEAGDGNDYIFNNANNGIISGGAGNDTVYIDFALANSIDAGAGNDSIYVDASNDTINGGAGDDTITLSYSDTMLMLYTPGDGNDLIQGFKEDSTLQIASNKFSTIINGDDVIVTVGKENITLEGAATVEPLNIVGTKAGGSYVIFTVKGSEVTYETDIAESIIDKTYQFKKDSALLTLNDLLKNYIVTVKNQENDSVKVNWHYGSASLSSASVMEYKLESEKNYMTLTSTNYGDKLTFNEDATITYDDIKADLFSGSAFSAKGKNEISFANNSSASVTAPKDAQIDIGTGTFIINNLNVNSTSGAGTITVQDDGLSFKGYGVQFIDLEVAKENYFKKVSPMTVSYKTSDKSYAIYNTACVKTLAHDFTKITLSFDDDSKNVALNNEKYAYYKVNGKEFLAANNADNLNVIEAKDSKFKIQGKEVEAGKISRVTIDEQISFTGTEIDFNDVKVNYAQNKVVSYTLDGKKVTIDKSAVVVAKGDTKTFNCAAGSYNVNGRSFETSAALTFTADANEIKIPLSDAATEIYFDGVTISGVKDGGELVFDLANDKIFVPNGAIINVTSPEAVKLNLLAGDFTVNENKISSAVGIEITADKDNIKIPLSSNAVTINGAKITGTHDATIDSQKIIALPDGALVENVSDNTFKLTGKNSAVSFGDANKKVVLTADGTAYMKYAYENVISVGLNSIMFENVQILGNDAWTIETAGINGVDKIKDITSGATITASMAEGSEGDLNFDVETEGNGSFTICEQKFISNGDAQNIFTVSNLLTDSGSSTAAVTAITKKLGTVDGNFEKGIQVNAAENKDDYLVKASNSNKDIEIALDTKGKMSVEKIEGGANVEKYGQAQKVITVKNDKEYSLQIADYKYTVSGDLDDDGITFELVDGDFKVRTLYENGLVTRYNVNDSEQLVWTWSIEQDKWIREQQSEDAPYEITINADKTLTLKANGVVVNPYSNQVITNPKSGNAVENAITITAKAIDGTTTFINNAEDTPNIFVADDQIITALAEKSSVQVDKRTFALKSETATATTFKLDKTRNTLKIASDYKIIYLDNYDDKTEVSLENDNNDIALSNCANVVAPAGKIIQFNGNSYYTVNDITFDTSSGSKAETVARGVKFDLSTGNFQYKTLTLEGTGTAQITQADKELITLTDGAIVKGGLNKFKYYNRRFLFSGTVELIGKKFSSNKQVRGGLIYFQTSIADYNPDGSYTEKTIVTTGFVVGTDYVEIQENLYDSVKIVDEKISSVEGVKNLAVIAGNGSANISIVTTGSGSFTIGGKNYVVSGDNDGVNFVTDNNGNVSKVNGLNGTIEGDFTNEISVNGKAIQITGASSIKVASDGTNVTEISNVAGDLVTTDGKTYRQNVYVYKTGGAKKLTTSADGIIIFNGKSFETNAGKTFELDEAGNVLGLEKVQTNETANVLENVAENLGTITLSTTSGLDEVIGDFSAGLTVNGVFVRVTDSTNFVVKNDEENIYIETTAQDTFTINGRTFTTSANKTIFKLDASGNVSEIVTDRFLPDEEAYLIEGDFSNEIIFNGQKFCVTGINDTSIFIGDETLITIELARNAVEVVESSGASEIALTGEGDITVGGKSFSTSSGFVGTLKINSAGDVYSLENFNGTIEGELGGLDLAGLTIESDDSFSVTGNGEKVIAIENLQNGTLTSDNLDAITINGEKVTLGDSDEVTLTIADGKLITSDEETLDLENATVISKNTTLKGGEVVVVEDTSAKLKITASKGQDTIYTAGKNIDIDLKGGATKIYAAGGHATVENYKATSGAGFITKYSDLNSAIDSGAISFRKGKLKIDSAVVDLGADSKLINFYDAADDLQKIGFASDDAKLDASNETESLILIGGNGSTIAGGKGNNQIRLEEKSDSTIILSAGKNTVENFNASFDGDKISVGAATYDFSFDGANVSVKSGDARALLENISSDDDAARILTLINGKEIKTAIAQEGMIISAGNDMADVYYGKKSGVDFTGFENSLTVDLSENFYGINRVTLGGGQNTLISSSANETLTSSDGSTEFIFNKDSGRDVIKNFNFDADRINVGNETITAVNVNSSGGVRMEISGSATLRLEDAQGKNFQINNFVVLVDKNLTYNAEANYFVATSNNATITVGEGAEIWLDGSHGKTFSGDIRTLDASTAQGNTSLVGNNLDNTILAGNGDSSLWGGNGGDDLLVGGTGKNTFFYTIGNGSDTISGANNGDIVYLAQVTLEQIASSNITADAVTLNFKDGGSLQVNSAADITYQLADGSKFSANHEQSAWLTK